MSNEEATGETAPEQQAIKDEWKVVKAVLGDDEFALNSEGIYQVSILEGRIKPNMLICAPLYIIADSRDGNGENWGRILEFRDKDKKLQRYHMKMQDLRKDGDEVIDALLSRGLSIAPGKQARNRLIEYIQNGQPDNNAKAISSDKTGWHDNQYILPLEVLGEGSDTIIYHGRQPEPGAYDEQGTLIDWQENVAALCIGNSRLILAVSTMFAAPLLQFIGDEGGGVHFVGSSSTGKSTALYVAASVMGSPKMFTQSWRATTNGLEGIAKYHNDSCLILDEIGQVVPKEAGEIAYMLANGAGKVRATIKGDARHKAYWKLLFLSSGEITLAEHMQEGGKKAKAGQEIRLVDIQADAGKGMGLFEELHGNPDGATFSNLLKKNAATYHGTAFRSYILALIKSYSSLPNTLRTLREDILDALLKDIESSGQVQRVAARFALIAAAGELATQHGITGWDGFEATTAALTCFRSWLEQRGGAGQQEERNLLHQVQGFFEKYSDSRFVKINRSNNGAWEISDKFQRVNNRAGFSFHDENGQQEFYVLTAGLHEICEGFNYRAAIKHLVEAEIITPAKDGKSQKSIRLPDMGTTKVFHVNTSMWTEH